MKLLQTDTLKEAREKLKDATRHFHMSTMILKTEEASSYICAKDIVANENIPSFRRSTVDGYAIKAKDSYGASESMPAYFQCIGSVLIDEDTTVSLQESQCMKVQTGSKVPDGADAVLMVEYTEGFGASSIAGYKAVSVKENVTQIGEDIQIGDCLIHKGKRLDAYDIGILVSLGIGKVEVYQPLKISVISTGDELIDFHEQKHGSQIRDINTYTIASQVRNYGMHVVDMKRVKDQQVDIQEAVSYAMEKSDIVILSGGSSKGEKDYTESIFETLTHHVLTHGIAIKPGKPTLLAFDDKSQSILVGLPGHPMAALLMLDLIIYDWFLNQTHCQRRKPYFALMQENVSSNQGRETCLLVSIEEKEDDYVAYPIYAKSGHISSLVHSFGYTLIPRQHEGLKKGERIRVEVLR